MKKFITASVIVIILAGGAFLLNVNMMLNEGEGDKKANTDVMKAEDKHMKHSCCEEEDKADVSGSSIYQLDSEWLTQNGGKFYFSDLKGKTVVMTMFYASCTYACPILINDMKRIEEAIDQDDLEDYRFVLVSIDPEKDTPQVLKELVKRNKLDAERWTLLTGSADNVMELAALTGFKFKKDEKTGYSHSNIINFLNDKGEIIHQQTGLNQDITLSMHALEERD